MSKINDGGPAFPLPDSSSSFNSSLNGGIDGMSLRDWFAGQALAGVLAFNSVASQPETVAVLAYLMADAMLAHRAKATTE